MHRNCPTYAPVNDGRKGDVAPAKSPPVQRPPLATKTPPPSYRARRSSGALFIIARCSAPSNIDRRRRRDQKTSAVRGYRRDVPRAFAARCRHGRTRLSPGAASAFFRRRSVARPRRREAIGRRDSVQSDSPESRTGDRSRSRRAGVSPGDEDERASERAKRNRRSSGGKRTLDLSLLALPRLQKRFN